MSDFITQCATASDVTTWWASIPSTVPSTDRYIAELAKGTYTISSNLNGKTTTVAGSIVIRPASGSNQHVPSTNVAGPQSATTAVILNTSFGGTLLFQITGTSGLHVEDIQFIQGQNGTFNFNTGTFLRRCVIVQNAAGATVTVANSCNASNCIWISNNTAVPSFGGTGTFDSNTFLSYTDRACFGTSGSSNASLWKNNVALNLAASPTVDPWPSALTNYYSASCSNNATSNATAGNMPGSAALTAVVPSSALNNVSAYASTNARVKAGSVLLGAGVVSAANNGIDWYQDTRSSSTPTIGAVEFVTSPVTGPTINTQPSGQSVTTPATATFTVAATTSGGTLTYQWQRSTDSGSTWSNVSTGSGGTTSSYTTPATSVSGGNANNGDKYRCAVTDSNGTTNSSAATLTVGAAPTGPTINTQPSAQTVTAPATATFTVAATASAGSLTYQWQRSVNSGSSWANVSTGTGGTTVSYTTPATSVSGGNANNADQYRCAVTDSNGTTNSSGAVLTVNPTPGVVTVTLKNNTGTALASTVIPKVVVLKLSDMSTTLNLTSQSTNGSGVLTISSLSLTAATSYLVVCSDSTGASVGVEQATAA